MKRQNKRSQATGFLIQREHLRRKELGPLTMTYPPEAYLASPDWHAPETARAVPSEFSEAPMFMEAT